MITQVHLSQLRQISDGPCCRRARGFSLVEMLTVLAIIAIVLGILIPVLAAARTSARKSATLTVMSNLQTAEAQFEISNRRPAGFFTQKKMGATTNCTPGSGAALLCFTNLENMMLELAGGVVNASSETLGDADVSHAPPMGPSIIKVGPSATDNVYVDITKIGAVTQTSTGTQNAGYYRPDPKYFVAQGHSGGRTNLPMNAQTASAAGLNAMPVVVDAFGQPILAWVQDSSAGKSAFATDNSDAGAAQFYWGANGGFLQATSLGKMGVDQTTDSIVGRIVGPNPPNLADRTRTLEALCGNPSFPINNTTLGRLVPSTPRGAVIFHSAGPRGSYLSESARGGKLSGSASNNTPATWVPYGAFYQPTRDLLTDGSFDDIILATGN